MGSQQKIKTIKNRNIDLITSLSDHFTAISITEEKKIMGFTDNSKWWALSYANFDQQYIDIINFFLEKKKVDYACCGSCINNQQVIYKNIIERVSPTNKTLNFVKCSYQIEPENRCQMRYYTVSTY